METHTIKQNKTHGAKYTHTLYKNKSCAQETNKHITRQLNTHDKQVKARHIQREQ